MMGSGYRRASGLCVLLALAIATTACGDRRIGAGREAIGAAMPPPCTAEPVQERAPGIAEFVALGAGVRPQLAASHGPVLFMTVFTPCAPGSEIVLWELDTRTRSATATSLGISPNGLWHALGVADDGTAWIGTRNVLVHVRSDRTLETFSVPSAGSPVPAGFVSRAGSASPDGAITALAAAGDLVLLGRAGHHEITTFDTSTHAFDAIGLPRPYGEVKSLSTVGTAEVAFTATRSTSDPLGSHDAVGLLDLSTRGVAALPLRPGVLMAGGRQLGYASWTPTVAGIASELGVVTPAGAPRWTADAWQYDASSFAVRADGALAVRVGGSEAQIAFLDARGREARRVDFAAVRPSAQSVPALAFALFGPGDALWFAVRGRPEIYRIK